MNQPAKFTHQALCFLFYLLREGNSVAHSTGLTKTRSHSRLKFKKTKSITWAGFSNHLLPWSILIVAVGFLTSACKSDNHTSQNHAQIQFNKALHDFGTVAFNTEVSHDFVFTNPGNERLMIQDIQTSCGCTVPEWPTKPIKKGDKESIHIVVDADFPGAFRKTITVYYNGENSPDTLFIHGEVERTKHHKNEV